MHDEKHEPDCTDERGTESAPQTARDSADVKVPFAPHKDDDSPLGDTDQHSDA